MQPAPSSWTRIYWPIAAGLSVAAFVIAPLNHKNIPLLGGVILLALPELYCVFRHQWQNTLSDWVWKAIHVTRSTSINSWNAEHFLAMGSFLVIAADVDTYLWHSGVLAFGTGVVMSVWLTWHFFFRWWA